MVVLSFKKTKKSEKQAMGWIWLLGYSLPAADTLHSTSPHFGGNRNAKGAWKVGLQKDLEKMCVPGSLAQERGGTGVPEELHLSVKSNGLLAPRLLQHTWKPQE